MPWQLVENSNLVILVERATGGGDLPNRLVAEQIPCVVFFGGEFLSPELTAVVEPFVRRELFPNAKVAVAEIARDYVLRQIERYRAIEAAFQTRYGMTYEQFNDYVRARSEALSKTPSPAQNQAIMV